MAAAGLCMTQQKKPSIKNQLIRSAILVGLGKREFTEITVLGSHITPITHKLLIILKLIFRICALLRRDTRTKAAYFILTRTKKMRYGVENINKKIKL